MRALLEMGSDAGIPGMCRSGEYVALASTSTYCTTPVLVHAGGVANSAADALPSVHSLPYVAVGVKPLMSLAFSRAVAFIPLISVGLLTPYDAPASAADATSVAI